MSEPVIAKKEPCTMELKAGKAYAWCTCGLSTKQPLCDGSHVGSPFTPQTFKAEEDKTVALCACKHSKNPPYCDGSHNAL